MSVRVLLAACAACVVAAPLGAQVVEPSAEAQSTAQPQVQSPAQSSPIVYQGQLSYLDIPVTTTADLRFRLYDDAGAQLGSEYTLDGVDLDAGAFEAVLDFDAGFASAWLEVDVRSPAGDGEYVTLSPRQRISTLAPVFGDGASLGADGASSPDEAGGRGLIALRPGAGQGGDRVLGDTVGAGANQGERPGQSADAGGGSRGAGWLMAGSVVFYNGGNVGIGTGAPSAKLHVLSGGARTVMIQNTPTGGGNFGLQVDAGGQTSRAIFARATRTIGQNYGVFGQSLSSRGTGVFGQAASTFGITYGVTGVSRAASGTGVRGLATNPTGTNYGVYGEVTSPNGWAGWFEGNTRVQGNLTIGEGAVPFWPVTAKTSNNDRGFVHFSDSSELFSFIDVGFGAFGAGGGDSLILFSNGDANGAAGFAITIASNGRVGVGRSPAANDLEVEGEASKTAAGSWLANSDRRIKTQIEPVSNALDRLDQVRLVSFEYTDEYKTEHPTIADHRYLNVIAQEFARVFPEHVKGSGEFLPDGSEILQVDTYPLTIYSAAAVQELNAQNREQQKRLDRLEAENTELRERLGLLETLLLGEAP